MPPNTIRATNISTICYRSSLLEERYLLIWVIREGILIMLPSHTSLMNTRKDSSKVSEVECIYLRVRQLKRLLLWMLF